MSAPDVMPAPVSGAVVEAIGAQEPSTPAESYAELAGIVAAHSVRWAKPPAAIVAIAPEPLDLEVLALLASLRHVLSTQIHRRFNGNRAATTTQRRLKRLADAAWVARFQFHRRDGGGLPMCYSLTRAGHELLRRHGHPSAELTLDRELTGGHAPPIPKTNHDQDDRLLRQARHDVRVAGWVLAVERALPERLAELRGPEASVISPRKRSKSGDGPMLAPGDLCLPGGRTPHDFVRTVGVGVRVEVDRFQSVRPDATLIRKDGCELLVEFDDRLPADAGAAKLERYDHFLSGWSANRRGYARGDAQLPTVVFVCRDRARARECARQADRVLTACQAYAGEYPKDWLYPGRARIVFAAERDAHEALLRGWSVAHLPPQVRVASLDGDPRGRAPVVRARDIY